MWMSRVLLACAIAGVAAVEVRAAEKKKAVKPASAASPATGGTAAPAPVKSAADLAQEKLASAWAGKLDGAWSLELRPATPGQGEPKSDTLTFSGRRMESDMLMQEGAGGSNFTLTPQDEQVAVWETMQITPKGDRLLWRGEVRGGSMSGTLIRQAPEGAGEPSTWSFSGTKAVPVPSEPAPVEAPALPAE